MRGRHGSVDVGGLTPAEARSRLEATYASLGSGALTTVNNATTGLILAISLMKKPGARYAVMPSFTFAATPLAA